MNNKGCGIRKWRIANCNSYCYLLAYCSQVRVIGDKILCIGLCSSKQTSNWSESKVGDTRICSEKRDQNDQDDANNSQRTSLQVCSIIGH
jgi:hypothetical protein